jgi:hypothetical protein
MKNYTLWLDDINYVISNGFPMFMYLDHDLGGYDTTMVFLKVITPFISDGTIKIPKVFA